MALSMKLHEIDVCIRDLAWHVSRKRGEQFERVEYYDYFHDIDLLVWRNALNYK